MHWLLIGYMFLFIDRPFEVWPWLGDLRIERIYMCLTLAVWAIYPNKRFLPNGQHFAYAGLATAVLGAWVMSPWMDKTQPIIEDWFKILVFYMLLVTTVHDEKALKKMVIGFMAVMAMYLTHSLKEYIAGRHTYRMGISRMIGVDTTLGDPNSFGASIIYVLPFVAAIWRTGWGGRLGKFALLGYTGLSSLCILLTGSRGSLIGLVLWFLILMMGHRKRFLWLALFTCGAPVAFVALPPSLQNRFETIINPEVGPANARESGEGRIDGLLNGFTLWSRNPISGIGPGAWRPATGSIVESHNLYGQILGETGTIGALAFGAVIACFVANFFWVRKVKKAYPEWSQEMVFQVPAAIATSVFLLLFMGNFGHNLFRFSWLWYGGFLIISRYCIEERLAYAYAYPEEPAMEEGEELDGEWIPHAGHV
jgi:O-antigen ligase